MRTGRGLRIQSLSLGFILGKFTRRFRGESRPLRSVILILRGKVRFVYQESTFSDLIIHGSCYLGLASKLYRASCEQRGAASDLSETRTKPWQSAIWRLKEDE